MKTILVLLVSLFFSPSGNDIIEEAENSISLEFQDSQVKILRITIPENIKTRAERKYGQRFYTNELNVLEISGEGKVIARAIIDNVKGKTMPITFMVTYDIKGNILNSEVLKYREPYGGQVQSENWQKQFSKKNASSGFTVGKDVQSITGATISVNSLSKAIGKLTLAYQAIYVQ